MIEVEHNGRDAGKVWHVVDHERFTMPMAAFYDEPSALRYAEKVRTQRATGLVR